MNELIENICLIKNREKSLFLAPLLVPSPLRDIPDEDIAQISFGYGLFTGAFGLHHGLERVEASVIPMSSEEIFKTSDNPVFELFYVDVEEVDTFDFVNGSKKEKI